MLRSHNCGELTTQHLGQEVELAGWIHSYRNLGGLLFLDLRDRYGLTQLTISPESAELLVQASKLRQEWVIGVKGTVQARPETMVNKNMATGAIEVAVTELVIHSRAEELPFPIANEKILAETAEALRLKYRFLDLRRPKLQEMLAKKAKFIQYIRQYFIERDFVEISTPILANSSPEGARDFLIPSRLFPGKFYALPQAPQQFKQLLMVAGMDRYFQVAPCFRDEDTRVDRHYGEFYQLDMEMSFVDQEDIFAVMEPLMVDLTERFSEKKIIKMGSNNRFIRLSWRQAMTEYGSDKPDIRYELKIKALTEIFSRTSFSVFAESLASGGVIHALKIEGGAKLTRKQLDVLIDLAKRRGLGGLATFGLDTAGEIKSSFAKFLGDSEISSIKHELKLEPGDMALFASGDWLTVCKALGAVRIAIANELNLIDNNLAAWLWIVDYPMFEDSELEPGRIDLAITHFQCHRVEWKR